MKTKLLYSCLLVFLLLGFNTVSATISPVVISEVFYDSPLDEDMSAANNHNGEFIELYNPSRVDINISGWKITDSSSSYYIFPANSIIYATKMLLVAYQFPGSNFNISSIFPTIPISDQLPVFYHNRFMLSNNGEEIKLYDSSGQLVDKMSYRHGSTFSKTGFWNLTATNGINTPANRLRSIHRSNVHSGASGIFPLATDYLTLVPTPLVLPENIVLPVVGEIFNGSSVDQSLPIGTLPGEASVSPTGAATYQIPIEVPPGTNGMQPQLSVVYNSQGGSGILGVGWDISGGSSISRTPQNLYYDGVNGKVESTTIKFNNTDRLALDGQRLILLSGSNFEVGAEYGTETENFARVKIAKCAGSQDIYFIVTTKDGKTMEYGNNINSRLINAGNESRRSDNRVLSWKLNKVTDVNGNYMTYCYTSQQLYLQSIYYNSNYYISFSYNSITPKSTYIGDFLVLENKILKKIDIYTRIEQFDEINEQFELIDKVIKTYNFSYRPEERNMRLDAVSVNVEGVQLNSTKIEWGAESNGI